jgi:hypothetical protein
MEGFPRAPLAATVWLVSHHGAQLRWKGQLGGEGGGGANPNPPCQHSLLEETGVPGENPRLSAERWQTLFTWVRSENRTHDLRSSTVQGPCSDDCATEAPKAAMEFYQFHSVLCIHAFLGVSSRLLSVFCNRFLLCLLYDGGNEKNWDSLLLHQSILYTESIITAPTFWFVVALF